MGENRPLAVEARPFVAAAPRSRWPENLTARQLLRAADGLERIADTCVGRRREELEREADELRRRAWLGGGARPV
jgi:hypothetical protein